MSLSPHPHSADVETGSRTTPQGRDTPADALACRPWYRRARYGLPLLVIAAIVPVVVALIVQDSDTTPRGAGSATAESNPYDEAFGTFEPITRSGTGDSEIRLPAEAWNGGIITAHSEGPGHFDIATRWHSPNNVVPWKPPYMYRESGPYSGTFTYGLDWGRSIKRLEVDWEGLNDSTDGGPWEVTVAPISSAEELPGEASGTGDAVFLYSGDGADLVLDFRVVRDRDFFVAQRLPGGVFTVLVPPADRSGTRSVQLAPGPSIVSITTRGDWKATIK